MINDIAQKIDRMCAEYEYEGKNATQAITDNDDSAMWDLAEFFALGEEDLTQAVYNDLRALANN